MASPHQPGGEIRLSPAPWLATVAVLAVLFLGLVTAFAVGIYSAGWHGKASQWVVRILPLPAAFVHGRPVLVHDVLADTDAFMAYREARPEVRGVDLTREQIQSNVLTRLIQTEKIGQLAAERGVVVTDVEINAEFDAAKSGQALAEMLRQFKWSETEFKQKVIRVYLLQNKLRGTLGQEALDKALADQSRVVYLMKR